MPSKLLTSAQALALLAQTPPRIAALTAGLEPAQLQTPPNPDAWSAHEVLAHLRACADMWGACIMAMLAEDRPALRAINPRTWINKTDYHEQPFQPSLQAFATQRTELLAVLEPLSPDGWARAATVTAVGRVVEPTVLSYAKRLAILERPHTRQVARIVTTLVGELRPAPPAS